MVLLPDWVAVNVERERHVDDVLHEFRDVSRRLHDLDPRLDLVWVNENDTEGDRVPARFHIRRRNPAPLADDYTPIVGPNDEFMYPSHAIVEMMQRDDLWNDANMRRKQANKRRREFEREAQNMRNRDDLKTEFKERYSAMANPQVSMTKAAPWRNKVKVTE